VVVTIHGIAREELSFETSLLARLRVVIADLVPQRHVIRNARYFTESTRYPEDYFRGRIRGRVWDISNPIPDEFFAVDPVREPGRVLYTGSIIPRKRLLDLIAAMRTVCASRPDARLYVAGGEPHAAYAAKVKALVAELGLGGRVAFLGARPPRAMAEEYRRASVFVLPSGQETSPLAIGEAMASGVAVVATRVGGVPYLVHEGETGHTVAPGDVPALSDRIARVLDDPSYAAALGRAGRERAEERFRIDVVARQVRAMYDEAVGGG
jgi:glycosyltransferase involved in cell wall biosynthesis